MSWHDLSLALTGAVILGYVMIGLFFLRFWRQSRERLFSCFAISFFILALERVMLLAAPFEWVHEPQFYCTRLVAFLVIAWAIWDKNRPRD